MPPDLRRPAYLDTVFHLYRIREGRLIFLNAGPHASVDRMLDPFRPYFVDCDPEDPYVLVNGDDGSVEHYRLVTTPRLVRRP